MTCVPGKSNRIFFSKQITLIAILSAVIFYTLFPGRVVAEDTGPRPSTVLAAADHRTSTSLNGEWHSIIDPYGNGLYDGQGKIRNNGFAENKQQTSPGQLVEYSFQKSPTLKVPGDWNTQRESLMFYEGPLWYEKDFTYEPVAGHKVFLHVGAANYRSYIWVNGERICDHEGGFTTFDCEVTGALKHGKNFAVIAVDNTRIADGVPTLKTDWWNYGGLTRDVYLVDVPNHYIDTFDLHLKRGTTDRIEGWVHVEGATAGTQVKVALANGDQHLSAIGAVGPDGKAAISLQDGRLQLWAPGHPTLYHATLEADGDKLEDDIGFRTI